MLGLWPPRAKKEKKKEVQLWDDDFGPLYFWTQAGSSVLKLKNMNA